MAKTLEELYKDQLKALEYNRDLLKRCKNHEFPYDGYDKKGNPLGGETSKEYQDLFNVVRNMEEDLDEMFRKINGKKPSVRYTNVVKYEADHKCNSCQYISDINGQVICKNPKTCIDSVNGVMSCYEVCKFDSYLHHYLKVSPFQTGCRFFRNHFDEEETA